MPTQNALACDTLSTLLERGASLELIDVRSPAEYQSAHIRGALNIPVDVLSAQASRISAQVTAPVVLICQSGPRAVQARQQLAAAGLLDSQILEGGMTRWDNGDRPVERGVARWALERQVRLVAGTLVLSGILASTVAPRAKYLAGAIGSGLTFSAVSNTCLMGNLLSRLPYNRGRDFDPEAALAQIGASYR